jgi:hypothetical protein
MMEEIRKACTEFSSKIFWKATLGEAASRQGNVSEIDVLEVV